MIDHNLCLLLGLVVVVCCIICDDSVDIDGDDMSSENKKNYHIKGVDACINITLILY